MLNVSEGCIASIFSFLKTPSIYTTDIPQDSDLSTQT